MSDYEQAVFISYAWGGEREDIVNEIDETLQLRGIRIVRDKRALGYRGSIKEFMERIGRGSCIIVVISDKYLRSPNCMFELVEIAENKQFHDRVFPIVLSDANIYDPLIRIEYVKFWEGKRKELAKAMKTLDPANLHGIREEMDQYDRIRDKISGITSILKDMNTLTPDMHRDSEFSNLYDAIVERLQENATDVTDEFNEMAKKADREAQAEAERLAAQKAEQERIAKAEANRLAAQRAEAERIAAPIGTPAKAEPISVASAQKKPASKGMAFGIVAVVVLIICIAGGGFLFSSGALDFLSQGNITNLPASTPTTQAVVEVPATGAPDTFAVLLSPEEAAKSYDSTLSVIQYALRVFGSFDPDKPTQMENPNLEPLKIRGEVCGTTQADLEKNVMLHEVYFELNGQRIPDSKVSTLDDSGFDSANNEVACRVYFVILGNWEKGSTYSIKEGENVVEAYKYGVDEMQAGAGSYEFIISIP